MKVKYRKYIFTLIAIVSSFLVILLIRNTYINEKNNISILIYEALEESLLKECDIRIRSNTELFKLIDSNKKPEKFYYRREGQEEILVDQELTDSLLSLSPTLLKMHVAHSLFGDRNPMDIKSLDSLFKNELKNKDLEFKTGIKYVDNQQHDTVYINYSNLDLDNVYITTPIQIGIIRETTIEGFITQPTLLIIKRQQDKIIPYLLILLASLSILGFILFRKKRPTFFSGETPDLKPRIDESTRIIVKGVYFDEKRAQIFNENLHITLTKKELHFMQILLRDPQYFAAYKTLEDEIWYDTAGNSYERLMQLVRRYRKKLKAIPELRICTIPQQGYQLRERSEQDTDNEND